MLKMWAITAGNALRANIMPIIIAPKPTNVIILRPRVQPVAPTAHVVIKTSAAVSNSSDLFFSTLNVCSTDCPLHIYGEGVSPGITISWAAVVPVGVAVGSSVESVGEAVAVGIAVCGGIVVGELVGATVAVAVSIG